MNRQPKPRPLIIRNRAYRRAFQRISEALERQINDPEKIRLWWQAVFADKDKPEESGEVKIPQ